MNFANLVGMYKVALNRCIDVIACNEENSSVEEIIDAVDCTLTMIDGNEDLLALLTLDDTYRLMFKNYQWNEKVRSGDIRKTVAGCTERRGSRFLIQENSRPS